MKAFRIVKTNMLDILDILDGNHDGNIDYLSAALF